MKTLIVTSEQLKREGRWDIDYHLPPEGIRKFTPDLLVPVKKCADIVKTKKDPTRKPNSTFQYIDISSTDVETGIIERPQELTGEEAPSRARKLVRAYDIIISTCRPTRGAIAVVPENLHGQICSTGYSVIRAKDNVNPFYLHFALRLSSTLEQFRKWSTGSSYPAILDEDVAKTLIPLPDIETQDKIAEIVRRALAERERALREANNSWASTVNGIIKELSADSSVHDEELELINPKEESSLVFSLEQIRERIAQLPSIEEVADEEEEYSELSLFDVEEDDF